MFQGERRSDAPETTVRGEEIRLRLPLHQLQFPHRLGGGLYGDISGDAQPQLGHHPHNTNRPDHRRQSHYKGQNHRTIQIKIDRTT